MPAQAELAATREGGQLEAVSLARFTRRTKRRTRKAMLEANLFTLALALVSLTLALGPNSDGSPEGSRSQQSGGGGLVMLAAASAASSNSAVPATSTAVQTVLLDTTEQSSLGWTRYPDGGPHLRTPGWVEESFTNFERGINWRSFVVCDVAFASVNNWLWTPWIERGQANRLYIEIKFTMRDCNLFPQQVLSCKETFALLYKETEAPIGPGANQSFAQADSFQLVDAIAADEGRFTSNTDVVINTEVRSVPVSKRGVYFAFRDQGACLSLISIRVYSLSCAQLGTQLAHFPQTPAGRDLTSLVAVEGQCVGHAHQVERPRMICTADGQGNGAMLAGGQCRCDAGYEPHAGLAQQPPSQPQRCLPCAAGSHKPPGAELDACAPCPAGSSAPLPGAAECRCHEGWFRSARDPRGAPCTQPPGPPANLSLERLEPDLAVLQWRPPAQRGGRDDLFYRLLVEGPGAELLLSSPPNLNNFGETRSVLANLQPGSSYRVLVYAANGVSQLAQQPLAAAELLLQTPPRISPAQQTAHRQLLSSQAGLQLLPVHNFRALAGSRPGELVVAWEAQTWNEWAQHQQEQQVGALELANEPPALYEVRYQPRQQLELAARRSPYAAFEASQAPGSQQPQSATSTGRALLLTNLLAGQEYALQVRAKWAHAGQWTDWSEFIQAHTLGGAGHQPDLPVAELGELFPPSLAAQPPPPPPRPLPSDLSKQPLNGGGWLLLVALAAAACALGGLLLLHRRRLLRLSLHHSLCPSSAALGGFGQLGASGGGSSTYGGVYGGGPGAFGSPLGAGSLHHNHHHHHHHHFNQPHLAAGGQHAHTLSAGSAGGLISASNGSPSSRSSSGGGGGGAGAGNVVQNFIAATLNQISGHQQPAGQQRKDAAAVLAGQHLTGQHLGKQLFAAPQQQQQQQQRNNHYQQHHTLLNQQHPFQQQHHPEQSDLFRYRTLGGQQPGATGQPELHIYDDLEPGPGEGQPQHPREIEPQRVSIESVLGRGEFGDVCLATLAPAPPSPQTGLGLEPAKRVAVKTLKAPASDRAKLDFLVEASIMAQFQHPNILRLEGLVSKGEPMMLVSELMENGALDAYLRENKNRFTCGQLISMLHDIASGMHYLAKLNYVHKDLAARNILVNGLNVCKIADFGLSAHQPAPDSSPAGNYMKETASESSSLSSRSTTTGGSSQNNSHIQLLADQLAHRRLHSSLSTGSASGEPAPGANQNPKIPVRWTALESIAFRRFTSASDVWSFGVVCWEVMTEGERPYWNWSNQDVIKAVEQGYRLPQPDGCPELLYKTMLDCWLKDRLARPTFAQLLRTLERLLSPYDDPFHCGEAAAQLVPMQTRISSQEPAYYDTYNPISQLISNKPASANQQQQQQQPPPKVEQQSVDEWLQSIKMSRYRENFQRHQINTLQYAARLGQADLGLIGVQNGQHVKKILAAIAALRSSSSIGASGEGYLV